MIILFVSFYISVSLAGFLAALQLVSVIRGTLELMSIASRRLSRASSTQALTPPSSIPTSYVFKSTGLTGGGFQNDVAVSPFLNSSGQRPYLLGADVSGIHQSLNRGQEWEPRPSPKHISALLWSNKTPGLCYTAAQEGFYRSTDYGTSWSQRNSSAIDVDANRQYHPRATGNLIAQETSTATTYLWAGTYSNGIKRSTDDGSTWPVAALAGYSCRSVVVDPNNPDIVYVAIINENSSNVIDTSTSGIYRSTNARSASMNFTKLTGSSATTSPEELFIISEAGTSVLYAATRTDGIVKWSGGTFTALNTNVNMSARWESITGYRSGNSTVLYIGSTNNSNHQQIMRSTNSGGNWTAISNGTVDYTVYGTSDLSWLSTVPYHNFAGNGAWTAAQIELDPDYPDRLMVAGRGGAWVGFPGSSYTWQPAHNGLMVTVCMAVETDPFLAGRLAIGNMDYTSFVSNNHGEAVINNKAPYSSGITTGDVVVYDPRNGDLYVSASVRGQNTGSGEIYSTTSPYDASASWTNQNLPVDNDIPSLGVGYTAGVFG